MRVGARGRVPPSEPFQNAIATFHIETNPPLRCRDEETCLGITKGAFGGRGAGCSQCHGPLGVRADSLRDVVGVYLVSNTPA
jgi:hypothetical protein